MSVGPTPDHIQAFVRSHHEAGFTKECLTCEAPWPCRAAVLVEALIDVLEPSGGPVRECYDLARVRQ